MSELWVHEYKPQTCGQVFVFPPQEQLKIHAYDCQEENLYTIIQTLHLD